MTTSQLVRGGRKFVRMRSGPLLSAMRANGPWLRTIFLMNLYNLCAEKTLQDNLGVGRA